MREKKLINWLQLVPFVFVLVYSGFGLASTTDFSQLKREYHSFSNMEIDFLMSFCQLQTIRTPIKKRKGIPLPEFSTTRKHGFMPKHLWS